MTTPRTEHLVLPGVLTAEQAAETVAGHPRRAARGRRHPVVPRAPPRPVGPHRGRDGAGRGRRARGRRAGVRRGWPGTRTRTAPGTPPTPTGTPPTSPTAAARPTSARTSPSASGTTTWPPATTPSSTGCGRPSTPPSSSCCGSSSPAARSAGSARPTARAVNDALLTGSSSVHQALRCALAIAEEREEPQPDWELAAGALRHAIRRHPERFLDKSRYSMDWYYPVLGGALTGRRGQGPYRGGLGPLRGARASACAACCPTRG